MKLLGEILQNVLYGTYFMKVAFNKTGNLVNKGNTTTNAVKTNVEDEISILTTINSTNIETKISDLNNILVNIFESNSLKLLRTDEMLFICNDTDMFVFFISPENTNETINMPVVELHELPYNLKKFGTYTFHENSYIYYTLKDVIDNVTKTFDQTLLYVNMYVFTNGYIKTNLNKTYISDIDTFKVYISPESLV